jgi:hypothetical protein
VKGSSEDIGQGYRLLDEEELLAHGGWEEPARLELPAHSTRRRGLRRALVTVLLGAGVGAVIGLLAAAGLRALTRAPLEGLPPAGRASGTLSGAPARSATDISRGQPPTRDGEVRDRGTALHVRLAARRRPVSGRPAASMTAHHEQPPVVGAAPAQDTPPAAVETAEFGFER